MKLSRLYANDDAILRPIKFEEGLNVIVSTLSEDIDSQNAPEVKTKSSHNAGKTTLFYIIDFCLLSGQNEYIKLIREKDEYKNIIFFLEVEIESNSFITIQRSLKGKSENIFLSTHNETTDRITSWDYKKLGIEKAKDILNKKLSLTSTKDFDYRKCLGYSMRPQKKGYLEIFKTKAFLDKDWKPYTTHILGLNSEIVEKKYDLEDEVKKVDKGILFLRDKMGDGDYSEVKSDIDLRERDLKEIEKNMENFDFRKKDSESIDSIIYKIGDEISYINNAIYNLKHKLKGIEESLSRNLNFNLKSIEKIFKEMGVYFGSQITNDYKKCIDFNKKITKGRKESLRSTKKMILKEMDGHAKKLEILSQKKAMLVKSFRETDSFKNLKSMTGFLSQKNAEIEALKEKLSKLSVIRTEVRRLHEVRKNLADVVQELRDEVEEDNKVFEEIQIEFANLCKKALGNNCILCVKVNDQDNIDFDAKFQNTSKDKGSSWKRILCILFDLCLIYHYRNKSFFKFVFHDSPFDGVDDATKNQVVKIYRDFSVKYNLQCVLTILDSQFSGLDKENHFSKKEEILKINSKDKLLRGPTF